MASKAMAGQALREFIREYGVPEELHFDGSLEQNGPNTEFTRLIREHGIKVHRSEPHRPQQNPAEGAIRELKRRWYRLVNRYSVPLRLWDYGMRWVTEIMCRTTNSIYSLAGRTPLEAITGETPDISEYLDFGFYDYFWFKENAGFGPNEVGRWLGVSHNIGNAMSYWILKSTGSIVSRSTVQRITDNEKGTDEVKTLLLAFDEKVKDKLADKEMNDTGVKNTPASWLFPFEHFDPSFDEQFEAINDDSVPEADVSFTSDTVGDQYIGMELALPRGDADGPQFARVTKRLKDKDGLPIGTADDNPLLDTRMYEVMYHDGHVESMAANVINENMIAQVDDEGNRHPIFQEIADHRRLPTAVSQQDAFITMSNGVKRRRITTAGWELLVQWKDGSANWFPLKDVKNSMPLQVAEYAVAARIAEEPAFAWWVPHFA
jgi:hypothetical protein